MKKGFMFYYSLIVMTILVLYCFYDFLVNDTETFWSLALFTPVVIWLFIEGEVFGRK